MVILTAVSFAHFLILIINCSICGSQALDVLCTSISIGGYRSGSEIWDKYIATIHVAMKMYKFQGATVS